MLETSSLAQEPRLLSFSEFLAMLISAFEKEGLRFCVLRNYEGFPARNAGNDVDLLILPSELPRALRALRSVPGIRTVGYTERSSVALTYSDGISSQPDLRALQVDFIMSLAWKGMPYLTAQAVLDAAAPRSAGDLDFFVPSPVHEAIISLLSSLLIGGSLKEKYFTQVQQSFVSQRQAAIAAMAPQFGERSAARLVDAVIDGDRNKIVACVRPLRVSLALRGLLHSPSCSVSSFLGHYLTEFNIRFTRKSLETVCLIGPDPDLNSTIMEKLIPMLQSSAKTVERRDFAQWGSAARNAQESSQTKKARDLAGSGFLSFALKSAACLLMEWKSRFSETKNLTIAFYGESYENITIASRLSKTRIQARFAHLFGKLFPSHNLWILLEAPGVYPQPNRQGQSPADAAHRIEVYRSIVTEKKNHIILDARQPVAALTASAFGAIIETFARRAGKLLDEKV